jgi:NAD(P)-dependent dehydrogenase (short-subunit alcohol dehydrogenase family)
MIHLKDKVIIVTGGNGLLGSKLLHAIKEWGGIPINADLVLKPMDFETHVCDIADMESVEKMAVSVLAKHGRIDGFVNNAYPRTTDWGNKWEDISVDSWRANVDMHLNGYFITSKVILEIMKRQKFGSFVNMASIYGMVGPHFEVYDQTSMTMPAAYSAIKGGIINLTRYLASYFGPHQIRINAVSPGGIYDFQSPQFVDNYERIVPLKRMGKAEEIPYSVCFLLSDAASYITGQNIVVDGGWTAI